VNRLKEFLSDRMQLVALLIVACFASVFVLTSQSGASYSTYLLALVMLATIPRWNDVFPVRLFWLILALTIYLPLTALWSTPFEIGEALSIVVRSVLIVTFVVAFAECALRGQLQLWLARALAVVGSLATLAAIAVFVMTDPEDGRLNGLGQLDTHVIAALVFGVVLIVVLRVLIDDESLAWRSFAIVASISIVAAIYLSDSRNAWVSVSAGVAVYALARATPDRQRFVSSVVAAAFLGTFLLLALGLNEETRSALFPRGDSFRAEIWATTLERILEGGPWFGVGILTDDEVQVGEQLMLHPHNLYLAVFYQGGLVGLA
jgi:hypothetical protein